VKKVGSWFLRLFNIDKLHLKARFAFKFGPYHADSMSKFYISCGFMHLLRLACWLILLALSACGGGGGGGGAGSAAVNAANVSGLSTGRLIDSSVEGVTYTVTTKDGQTITGVTDASGTFKYVEGEKVIFSIGDIVFPATLGDSIITPLTMAQGGTGPVATNVAFLLQSLDYDLDPSNGITIDPKVAQLKAIAAFGSSKIDWTQDSGSFANNAQVKTLITQAKVLNPDNSNPAIPAKPPITPETAVKHLNDTLFGSLDTRFVQPEGCAESHGLRKPTVTDLPTNLWADLLAKPKAPVYPGWIFDGEITQANALSAPGGDLRIYKPTAGSPEVKAAMQTIDWVSLDADIWLKHQGNPNVILRIAGKQRLGGDSVYYPKLSGAAIYLHYTGSADTALEFQFAPGSEPTAFFSFLGNNTDYYYRATAGKDGVINQGGDDGWNAWTQDRGDDWFRHQPPKAGNAADVNFPPNLHKGGTSPMGRALGTVLCPVKSGGTVLLWRKPDNNTDLYFSPVAQRNSVGVLAPMYSDAKGYQGSAGIRSGVKVLRILKASEPPVVLVFNPADALKRLAISGFTKSLTISGDCDGLLSYSATPLKADVLASDPLAVFSLTETLVATSANCPDWSGTDISTLYLNASYQQLADVMQNPISKHVVAKPYPTSVKVGDSGSWSAWVEKSTDLTTVLSNGVETYAVEADGASTTSVILVVTTKEFKPDNTLDKTTQMRYKIKPSSAAELVSIEQVNATSGKKIIVK
jgi:hypothetical protein